MASALRRHNYTVTCAATADEALRVPHANVVLLDMGLPDRDGVQVCRELRAREPEVPIIAVTARSEICDRVRGLRAGADDYVIKPFAMSELQARMEAVLRRAAHRIRPSRALHAGALRIEVSERRTFLADREIPLTFKEFEILLALARQAGTAVSRQELLLAVWQTTTGGSRALEVHVAALRAKLGDADLVRTVRCFGYQLRTE